MIVATLLEPTLEDLASTIRTYESRADLFEVRFDAFRTAPAAARVRELTRKPLIATARRTPDGGSFQGSEAARLGLLEDAGRAGFDFVDVEAGCQLPLPEDQLIRSVHELAATPTVDEILRRGAALVRNGGLFKFASRVRSFEDTLRLLVAARRLSRRGTPCAVMGLGPFPRALGHLLGNRLTYGGAGRTAPGQPRLEDVSATLAHWGNPEPAEQLYLVIGSPIDHSLSPRIHNAAFRAAALPSAYGALEVHDASELQELRRNAEELGLRGLSVTSPLKERAYLVADERTPEAEVAQAVNCIRIDGSQLVGHNTDGLGTRRVLEKLLPKRADQMPILLLGTGGAARGILAASRDLSVTLAGRSVKEVGTLAREFGVAGINLEVARSRLHEFGALINATAVQEPLQIDGFRGPLFDLQYAERPTFWQAYAQTHELPFAGGRDLLLAQAIPAFEFWTRRSAPEAVMVRALGEAA